MLNSKSVMEENPAVSSWRYKIGEQSDLNTDHSNDKLFSWTEGYKDANNKAERDYSQKEYLTLWEFNFIDYINFKRQQKVIQNSSELERRQWHMQLRTFTPLRANVMLTLTKMFPKVDCRVCN